ncbi:unnamed protein product [Cuscuta epithymum]|uniref:Replication protein A 70 kDa DNA-binding subunit B/D first OB fold domain-containing protein n=1 Tax=Cuscuta epithymum TaxID=186058 RepID=A0AAV0D957_9ASTE|nr:unnamed protein product [Cuscuta epithymum]
MWSLIKDVDHTKTTWALRVRVVRAYEVPPHSKGGVTLELVLHDEQGDRIHAIIKRPQLEAYKTMIKDQGKQIYALIGLNLQVYKCRCSNKIPVNTGSIQREMVDIIKSNIECKRL